MNRKKKSTHIYTVIKLSFSVFDGNNHQLRDQKIVRRAVQSKRNTEYNCLALICIKLLHSSVGITQFTSERHRIANQNFVRRKTSSPHRTRRNRSDWKTAKSGEREWKKCSSQANAFQHKQRIKISHYILSSDFLIYLFSVSIVDFGSSGKFFLVISCFHSNICLSAV